MLSIALQNDRQHERRTISVSCSCVKSSSSIITLICRLNKPLTCLLSSCLSESSRSFGKTCVTSSQSVNAYLGLCCSSTTLIQAYQIPIKNGTSAMASSTDFFSIRVASEWLIRSAAFRFVMPKPCTRNFMVGAFISSVNVMNKETSRTITFSEFVIPKVTCKM